MKSISKIEAYDDDEARFFVQLPDGRIFKEPTIIMDPEQLGKIRAGYMCIWCFEPLSNPFPKKCPLCTFPIRDKQIWMYGKVYAGIDIPPPSVQERLAEFDEQDAREAYEQGSQMHVKRNIK